MSNPYPNSRYPHALYFGLPDGKMLLFVDSTGSGNYVPGVSSQNASVAGGLGVGQTVSLNADGSQATLVDTDGTNYLFNNLQYQPASSPPVPEQQGALVAIKFRGGYVQTLNYDASTAQPTSVTDNLGRSLGFQFDTNQHLMSLASGGSAVATYTYIPNPQLAATYAVLYPKGVPPLVAQATGALGSVTLVPTNETMSYSYTNDANNSNYMILTGYTDPRGITYSTWTVDSSSRVTSNTLAGGVGQTSLSYSPANLTLTSSGYSAQTTSTTITNALGEQEVATYAIAPPASAAGAVNPNLLLTQRQKQAIGSLPVSTTTYAYDFNDFLSQVTDAQGRVTTDVNDPITGLPTSITRGAGTPGASTATYTWNDQWRVPTQIVEPGRTSAYVWSASGQLTSSTVTDTTTTTSPYSTNGQTRTLTYAYGANSLLASVTGPLAGEVVSYTFNSTGFIQTITDEVGHVTTVTAWNSLGQPTSLTDPNGVISALTYDGDGRLTGLSVDTAGTPATTTIAYDAVGDVVKITDPIGASTSFTYDGARRLTGLSNGDGETATYVRDALG